MSHPPPPPGESPTEPLTSRSTFRLSGLTDVLGMLIVLAGLILLFGMLSRYFWTGQTLRTIVNQNPGLIVVSVGMTLVLVVGGIDLAVGSVLAFAGVVLGITLVEKGWPLGLAFAAGLAVGGICGLINGMVSVF